MTVREKVEKLMEFGKNRPNNTVFQIAVLIDLAINEFAVDGDKIQTWQNEGREIRSIIESILGCRMHSQIDCDHWPCKNVREGV